MKLCSHGCGGMADAERELISRKDLKMESVSILKPDPGLFLTEPISV